MSDSDVRDKMNKLDTLTGGIVFGKEEAWDKLQARMDAQPAKNRIALVWRSAAALVLLGATIAAYILYTRPIAMPIAATLPTEPTMPAIAPAPITASITDTTTAYTTTHTPPPAIANTTRGELTTTIAVAIPINPPPEPKVIDPATIGSTTPMDQPTAPTPPKKTMRVVYLNELDEWKPSNDDQEMAHNSTTPRLDIRNMPVVHINELTNTGHMLWIPEMANRPLVSRLPFLRNNHLLPYYNNIYILKVN